MYVQIYVVSEDFEWFSSQPSENPMKDAPLIKRRRLLANPFPEFKVESNGSFWKVCTTDVSYS